MVDDAQEQAATSETEAQWRAMLVGFRLDPRVAQGGGQRGYAWFQLGDVCETRIIRRDQ